MTTGRTYSHHLLRRRARAKAQKLEALNPELDFRVLKSARGPWRWRVVAYIR